MPGMLPASVKVRIVGLDPFFSIPHHPIVERMSPLHRVFVTEFGRVVVAVEIVRIFLVVPLGTQRFPI